MSKLIWVALIILIFSMSAIFITFQYGDDGYLDSLVVSVALSIPLIIAFVFLVVFCRASAKSHAIIGKIAIGVYLSIALLYVFWNGLMLIDVLQKDGLGPAQGYSGLILWVGSIKAALVGIVAGILLHFLTKIYDKIFSRG
ncbi:hypothetical protein QUO13_000711 [Vibrio parahaemolyticus]|uniref:hypothetical protein n=1 Tax=Vibrio parahaemolyticus TaxID=670 RepID=UPI00064AABBA|nr:hypothetical protein [Vibrio parahaemolyticus]EHH2499576.1 hypothetical protein [Vibrio parahaemolyticus]EJG1471770.1 hypothetical protein [Vibrio parahaemolyticus]EKA7404297.1 hypothetical protein [Vibrio parahaemolyticus]EKG9658381.1 hypothetical protein [Vibrio parahaemolyticus]EKL9848349.1 hypothetical protein [Vibrio parahaemolyticus]